jgi:hypothetical protein
VQRVLKVKGNDMDYREIELERRLENLEKALKEYVDYLEYIRKANADPNKRKPFSSKKASTI